MAISGSKSSGNYGGGDWVERSIPIRYNGRQSVTVCGNVNWVQCDLDDSGNPMPDAEGNYMIKFGVNAPTGQTKKGEDRTPIYATHWFTVRSNSKSALEKGVDKTNVAMLAKSVRLGSIVLIEAMPAVEEDGGPHQYEKEVPESGRRVNKVFSTWQYNAKDIVSLTVIGTREISDLLHYHAVYSAAKRSGDQAQAEAARDQLLKSIDGESIEGNNGSNSQRTKAGWKSAGGDQPQSGVPWRTEPAAQQEEQADDEPQTIAPPVKNLNWLKKS
jgi:hypothetical protein